MAHILLIETATEVCSVAVAAHGEVLALCEAEGSNQHAARLTLLVQDCLAKSGLSLPELDAVAVSRGPGSYTGLRVGASVAKGICYALGKPLLAVETLEALALASRAALPAEAADDGRPFLLLPMIDARREEVWTAVYNDRLQALSPVQVLIFQNNLFEEMLTRAGLTGENYRFVFSGNGSVKAKKVLQHKNAVFSEITAGSAGFLAPLAETIFQSKDFQDIAYFEPFYMKPPNITTAVPGAEGKKMG
jgi:tRNA threonylcarbamoyladenosine biosynthesis protein TsaB